MSMCAMTLGGSFEAGPSPRPPPADTAGPRLQPPFMAVDVAMHVFVCVCVRNDAA